MTYLKTACYKVTRIFLKHAKSWNSNFWSESDDFKFLMSFTGVSNPSTTVLALPGWFPDIPMQTKEEKKKKSDSFHHSPFPGSSGPICSAFSPSFLIHSLSLQPCKVYFSFPNLNSTLWPLKNVTAFYPPCISEILKNNIQPHCVLLDFFLWTIRFTRLETHASSLQLLQLLKQLLNRLRSPH